MSRECEFIIIIIIVIKIFKRTLDSKNYYWKTTRLVHCLKKKKILKGTQTV